MQTVGDLRRLELAALEWQFGRYGLRLHELARGIDNSEVVPDRPTQSISAEDTFERYVPSIETEPMIRRLAEKVWSASRNESRLARTVVLKLKTSEFKILTRSHTPQSPPSSCEELTDIALSLRERVNLAPQQRFRLIGVGLNNFKETEDFAAQPTLFQLRAFTNNAPLIGAAIGFITSDRTPFSHKMRTIHRNPEIERLGVRSASCRVY